MSLVFNLKDEMVYPDRTSFVTRQGGVLQEEEAGS
jgi:hypothetical protein